MNTISNQVSDKEENSCPHCSRTFIRESTYLKHLCEQKRRWMDRDKLANRIAYNAWKQYYEQYHPNKKKTEYKDFVSNSYYTAFVKFGSYCVEIRAVNPAAFAIYLVKNRVPIDVWTRDKNYNKYLVEYLRAEKCLDAVKRSIDNMLDITQTENIQLGDVFRFINSNKICHLISTGHISPWVLYQSNTGKKLLSSLNETQTSLIFDYIDPEKWNIKFKREPESILEVQTVINGVPGL